MPDVWSLYSLMYRSRVFEESVRQVWNDGLISGEMHLGLGEEAINAGFVSQLQDGDAMALDHRGTSAVLMRGVDALALLREFMGKPDGLCRGQGGHMHLFAPELLAASSGIVGSAGPAAAGFALAAQVLRPGRVALAFFGDGATSSGMLMESMNLAVVWRLPVVFICKDSDWAITTPDTDAVGGNLLLRAQGFGLKAFEVDGADVLAVHSTAEMALAHARHGHGPVFVLAHCSHPEGHFLGDPFLTMARRPLYFLRTRFAPVLKALFSRKGAPLLERLAALRLIMGYAIQAQRQSDSARDPLVRSRCALHGLDAVRLRRLESAIQSEISQVVSLALMDGRPA